MVDRLSDEHYLVRRMLDGICYRHVSLKHGYRVLCLQYIGIVYNAAHLIELKHVGHV